MLIERFWVLWNENRIQHKMYEADTTKSQHTFVLWSFSCLAKNASLHTQLWTKSGNASKIEKQLTSAPCEVLYIWPVVILWVPFFLHLADAPCLCVQQEGGLKLTFQKQGLPLKRPLESEEGPQAQQQYLARLQELQSASDTGLADITKPQGSLQQGVFTYNMSMEICAVCVVISHPWYLVRPLDGSKVKFWWL